MIEIYSKEQKDDGDEEMELGDEDIENAFLVFCKSREADMIIQQTGERVCRIISPSESRWIEDMVKKEKNKILLCIEQGFSKKGQKIRNRTIKNVVYRASQNLTKWQVERLYTRLQEKFQINGPGKISEEKWRQQMYAVLTKQILDYLRLYRKKLTRDIASNQT